MLPGVVLIGQELQRALQILDDPGHVAQFGLAGSKKVEDPGVDSAEPKRLLENADGAGGVAAIEVDAGERHSGLRQVQLLLQRSPEQLRRSRPTSLLVVRISEGGEHAGAIFTRIDEPDPTFGPPRVTLANGTTQPNPLADRTRFLFDTRDIGQIKLGDTKRLSVKIGKVIDIMGPNQNIEFSLQVFNLLNLGDFQQFTYNGASAVFNPNFLQPRNRQSGRGLRFNAMFRF